MCNENPGRSLQKFRQPPKVLISANHHKQAFRDTPTYINLICYWLLQIPLAYFLGVTMGLETRGVFKSIALAQAMIALFGTIVFRRGNWKHTLV